MPKTFSDFDKLGLEPFAESLTKYLEVESRFVDESYVLSLNSEFGSGKTTFFEMWANKLSASEDSFKVVQINAWESDFQGEPLLAIVSCLLELLGPKKEAERVKETAGKLSKFALAIGNDVVQKATGVDLIKAKEYAEGDGGIAGQKPGHACFELYEERCRLFKKLRGLLRGLTVDAERPVLIIVDELDRCRPNYAIEFLETIKHFFDIKGLIFVMGVDKNQLAASAKALFGQDLVFDEYYRKFAHRNVRLPVQSPAVTEAYWRALVGEYLSEDALGRKKGAPYAPFAADTRKKIVELCVGFALNARQTHECFRIAAHALSRGEKSGPRMFWGWSAAAFFMAALSIKNRGLYEQIGRRGLSLSEMTSWITKLALFSKREEIAYWSPFLYVGAFGNRLLSDLKQEFRELDIWEPAEREEGVFEEKLRGCFEPFVPTGLVRMGAPFCSIYETIEGLRTFAEE